MSLPSTIAIDGPAASGKSTIGALLAQKLGYIYFDTGVMYRAVTWAALAQGIPIEDEPAVTRLSETLQIEVTRPTQGDGRQYTVYADGQDVTWDLRRPQVNEYVSPVSAYAGVREAMVLQQRRIAEQGAIVMVGRDIGTVVLPGAELKIYLDGTIDERARRRYWEVRQRACAGVPEGDSLSDPEYWSIRENLIQRDRIDSSRATSPLRPAQDAVIVDTTHMTIEQVLQYVLELTLDP